MTDADRPEHPEGRDEAQDRVVQLDYRGMADASNVSEPADLHDYWGCPKCGETLATWTRCPGCGWYDEAVWNGQEGNA